MASAGLALVAQERARLLFRQVEHPGTFGDRFRKLELTGVNALQIFRPSGTSGGAPIRRRAKRPQMDIIDPDFRQLVPQEILRKAGPPGIGDGANVYDSLYPRLLKRREELGDCCPLIADREDAHHLR